MLKQFLILLISLMISPFLWIQCALAQSSFDIRVTVNGHVLEERVTFSREHYFVVHLTFDFAGNGIEDVAPLSVTSKDVPAGFLSATHFYDLSKISVALNYPDPIYTAIDFESIGQFDLQLYVENEGIAVSSEILKALGDKGRFKLLFEVGKILDKKEFERVEDPLIAALVKSRLGSNRAVVNDALKQLRFAHREKIEIARMTLGFSNASEMVAMRAKMESQTHLTTFAKELLRHVGANDVVEYLING